MRSGQFLGGMAVALLLGLAAQLWACANEYESNVRDSPLNAARTPQQYVMLLQQTFSVSDEQLQWKLEASQSGRFQDISDYAVALMRRGEYQKSRDLFAPLAEKHPDEYTIAANLGTAYELTGDVPNALKWIRRGIELKPDAHEGTEWLHVKILEAKQDAVQNPKWFAVNTVAGYNFGNQVQPAFDNNVVKSMFDLRKALEYQLYERLGFVKNPDAVVANLLLSLGNALIMTNDQAKAYEVFKLAKQFEVSQNPLLDRKIAAYEPPPPPADPEACLLPILKKYRGQFIAAGAMLVASVIFGVMKRRRREVAPRG